MTTGLAFYLIILCFAVPTLEIHDDNLKNRMKFESNFVVSVLSHYTEIILFMAFQARWWNFRSSLCLVQPNLVSLVWRWSKCWEKQLEKHKIQSWTYLTRHPECYAVSASTIMNHPLCFRLPFYSYRHIYLIDNNPTHIEAEHVRGLENLGLSARESNWHGPWATSEGKNELGRVEGSTLSKDECTNCDQGKFRGFCTVLASQPIAGFRGIIPFSSQMRPLKYSLAWSCHSPHYPFS